MGSTRWHEAFECYGKSIRNMVRVAGVEPGWTCAQDMWVVATLHPDCWRGSFHPLRFSPFTHTTSPVEFTSQLRPIPPSNLELARSASNCGRAFTVAHSSRYSYTSGAGRSDSNADHGLTRPALFLLRYTSETFFTKTWRRWGELHSRLSALQADALLSWLHRLTILERKAGLEPALSTLATSRLGR